MNENPKNHQKNPKTARAQTGKKLSPIEMGYMDTLFQRLFAIRTGWRASFTNARDQEMLNSEILSLKKTWFSGFQDAGLSDIERINVGLARLKQEPERFLPSIGEFIALCRPTYQDLGMPLPEEAYREACEKSGRINQRWSHTSVWYAAGKVGIFNLRNYPELRTRPRFISHYEFAYLELCAGRTLPVKLPPIDQKLIQELRSSREKARSEIDKLKAMMKNTSEDAVKD